jgi:hypothetical protein
MAVGTNDITLGDLPNQVLFGDPAFRPEFANIAPLLFSVLMVGIHNIIKIPNAAIGTGQILRLPHDLLQALVPAPSRS